MGFFDFFKESEEHKAKRLAKKEEINKKYKEKMAEIDRKYAEKKEKINQKKAEIYAKDEERKANLEKENEILKEKIEKNKKEFQEAAERLNELRHTCPICGNKTDFTAYEKGYGVGKGLTGAALFGPYGLLAGFIGKGKVYLVCNKCGHKMKI